MAIDPEALESFLFRDVELLPEFKGADPDWLHDSIHRSTGIRYEPKTSFRKHQLEGLAAALWMRRGFLFYDTRLGKTKIALDWASALRQGGFWQGQGLVITHAPIGTETWRGQIPQHSDLTFAAIQSGPKAEEQLLQAVADEVNLIVMSWSTIQTLMSVKKPSRKGPLKLYPAYDLVRTLAAGFSLVIVDEIHACKDWTSLWFTLGCELVKHCDYRLGLTATPSGRNPFSIWSQAYLVDNGETLGRSYPFFQAAFGKKHTMKLRNGRLVEEYRFDKSKWPILQKKLASISFSYARTEVHEENVDVLPVILDLTPKQAAAYDEQLELARELREDDTRGQENIFMRLRQISSGFMPFADDEGEKHLVKLPCSKLEWLEDFLENVDPDLQFIIYHDFVASGKRIAEVLEKRGISYVRLWGGTKNRGEVLEAFKSGKAKVFVANAAAGSMSIDLPEADYILYYESPTSAIVRKQSQDRPMSRGAKLLLVDDLVSSPVERRILTFVREGKNVMAELQKQPGGFYGMLKRR